MARTTTIRLRAPHHLDKPKRRRGRPPQGHNFEEAEQAAAKRVVAKQQDWRKQHNRKRVPSAATEEMIDEEIKETALKKSDVLRILKTGRVKPG
jgi:hypothetical protein